MFQCNYVVHRVVLFLSPLDFTQHQRAFRHSSLQQWTEHLLHPNPNMIALPSVKSNAEDLTADSYSCWVEIVAQPAGAHLSLLHMQCLGHIRLGKPCVHSDVNQMILEMTATHQDWYCVSCILSIKSTAQLLAGLQGYVRVA